MTQTRWPVSLLGAAGLVLLVLWSAGCGGRQGDGNQGGAGAEERRRTVEKNLKQIGLAFHNYAAAHNDALPPPAITNAQGKALLSWRVAILPYLEQDPLYKEFKLDEAWDSAHNKKLLAKMPAVFAPVGVTTAQPNSTFLQLFTGPKTPWPTLSTRMRLTQFTDGTPNTILVAEAGDAVPWTKPVDLALDPDKPLPKLGAHLDGVFLAVFADVSIRTLRRDADAKDLRLLIDPHDGQVIPWDRVEAQK